MKFISDFILHKYVQDSLWEVCQKTNNWILRILNVFNDQGMFNLQIVTAVPLKLRLCFNAFINYLSVFDLNIPRQFPWHNRLVEINHFLSYYVGKTQTVTLIWHTIIKHILSKKMTFTLRQRQDVAQWLHKYSIRYNHF